MNKVTLDMYDATEWQKDSLWTWANLVTVVRVIGLGIAFAVIGLPQDKIVFFWLMGVHVTTDVLDGALARALNQETRFGAQIDILADRFIIAFFYILYWQAYPEFVIPIALFLFQFMVLDHYLSNQFLRYPLISINYFYDVDRPIWLLNWSTIGKFCNGGLVTLSLLLYPHAWLATSMAVVLIGVKLYSAVRLHRLP